MPLEDETSLDEASYLLRVPANAERLQASIRSLEAGEGTMRELAESEGASVGSPSSGLRPPSP